MLYIRVAELNASFILCLSAFAYFQDVAYVFINRMIFRWLTAKNLHTLEFDTDQPSPPERLLAAFKSGSGSYARAFEYMARCELCVF